MINCFLEWISRSHEVSLQVHCRVIIFMELRRRHEPSRSLLTAHIVNILCRLTTLWVRQMSFRVIGSLCRGVLLIELCMAPAFFQLHEQDHGIVNDESRFNVDKAFDRLRQPYRIVTDQYERLLFSDVSIFHWRSSFHPSNVAF